MASDEKCHIYIYTYTYIYIYIVRVSSSAVNNLLLCSAVWAAHILYKNMPFSHALICWGQISYGTLYWITHEVWTTVTLSELLALCVGNPPVTGGLLQRTNNAGLWCFPRSYRERAVQQVVELSAFGEEMPLMWHHCNAKCWNHTFCDVTQNTIYQISWWHIQRYYLFKFLIALQRDGRCHRLKVSIIYVLLVP